MPVQIVLQCRHFCERNVRWKCYIRECFQVEFEMLIRLRCFYVFIKGSRQLTTTNGSRGGTAWAPASDIGLVSIQWGSYLTTNLSTHRTSYIVLRDDRNKLYQLNKLFNDLNVSEQKRLHVLRQGLVGFTAYNCIEVKKQNCWMFVCLPCATPIAVNDVKTSQSYNKINWEIGIRSE